MFDINKVHWVQLISTQFHFKYTFFILYTMAHAPQANAAGTLRFISSKRQRSIYRASKKRRGTCVDCTMTFRGKLERRSSTVMIRTFILNTIDINYFTGFDIILNWYRFVLWYYLGPNITTLWGTWHLQTGNLRYMFQFNALPDD